MSDTMLTKLFGTDDPVKIVEKKSKERQDRLCVNKAVSRVEMTSLECEKACKKIGIEYLPGYESRVLRYTMSDETVDRYGDIVRASGVDAKNFMRNPVVMTFHDYNRFPVGNALSVNVDKANKRVVGNLLFVDDRVDKTGMADTAFRFASSGVMRAGSIGFIPTETNEPAKEEAEKIGLGKYGVEFVKWELLEFSVCGVPANPNAVQETIRKGVFDETTLRGHGELFSAGGVDAFIKALNDLETCGECSIPETLQRCVVGELEDGVDFRDDHETEITTIRSEELLGEEIELKPFPNEHACRLQSPSKYEKFRRGTRKSNGKVFSIIFGKLKGEDVWEQQAFRYAKDVWEVADARKHCKDHDGKLFEPATGDEAPKGLAVTIDGQEVCYHRCGLSVGEEVTNVPVPYKWSYTIVTDGGDPVMQALDPAADLPAQRMEEVTEKLEQINDTIENSLAEVNRKVDSLEAKVQELSFSVLRGRQAEASGEDDGTYREVFSAIDNAKRSLSDT